MRKGILCCPVCNSSNLRISALINYLQDEDGCWKAEELDMEDVRDVILQDYAEIYCENPHCGQPYIDGQPLLLEGNEGLYEYWLRINQMDLVGFNDLTAQQHEDFNEFLSTVEYEPWSGTIRECVELDR